MQINHLHPFYESESSKNETIEKRFNILYGRIIEKRQNRENVREYTL